MSTNLKEATAKVTVVGLLAEKDLKVESANGVDIISGSVTIKVSDTDSIQFRVKQASKRSDGKKGYTSEDNKVYPGLVTVMNEYKSIADVGEADADRIAVISGQIKPYFSVQNDREHLSYQTNFFSRDRGVKDDNKAEFEVEIFIKAIVPEVYTSGEKQGDETGRAIVKGLLPTYSGIETIDLVAPAEDGIADAILSDYTPGQTVRFFGDVINRKVEKTTTVPVKIGKPKVTTSVTYTNELVITGASEAYDGETGDTAPYDVNAIKQAMTERDSRIAELKEKNKNNSNRGGNDASPSSSKPASSGKNLPW